MCVCEGYVVHVCAMGAMWHMCVVSEGYVAHGCGL